METRHVKLTASLIIRQELDRYLGPCIEHLLAFCDQIVILDDGSSDGWHETLAPTWGGDSGRVIVHRHDTTARDGYTDFHLHAAARNRLLQVTLTHDPGWVLAIDADEFVSDGAALRRACEATSEGAVSLEICEVWEACDDVLCVRQDGGWRVHPIGCVWDTSRLAGYPLMLTDRGHATGRVPEAVHKLRAFPSGADLLHFGWANVAERAVRFKRYDVGDGGRFHARQHIDSIMWPAGRVTLQPFGWPAWPDRLADQVRAKAGSDLPS